MKLQKQLSRKVGGKEYSKWVIIIPPDQINKLGWKAGENLEGLIEENKLVVKCTNKNGKF